MLFGDRFTFDRDLDRAGKLHSVQCARCAVLKMHKTATAVVKVKKAQIIADSLSMTETLTGPTSCTQLKMHKRLLLLLSGESKKVKSPR